ncbi:translation initiation factor eIF3h [Schizosaccharomyces japonicus yFS275]|uniref:Eukaryotic translation initiation factor 3 subunit H n=1 Tax=Schizosaccharomyces japonicus (strain yFS275 / FY16936) TaxID=402676 RepID=B6JW90_SCHJY|nr:translation initiation factor eIF3h [Schizosaccharomyces japonicus yFS275]EEB05641.1 translation initiation factor eIF3h [Schizosaccharomyces japonicus yFS275]
MSEMGTSRVLEDLSTPIATVELESLVVLNIIKHCRESFPSMGTIGQLVGIDIDGVLQISNSFASPAVLDNEESPVSKSVAGKNRQAHTENMLARLKQIGVPSGHAGWYHGAYVGSFLNSSFVETQFAYQKSNPNSIALVYDLSQSTQGSLFLHAYQLTSEFMAVHAEKTWSASSLTKHELKSSNILREIPIIVYNSHLATCMLHSLSEPEIPETTFSTRTEDAFPKLPLTETYADLELTSNSFYNKNLSLLLESIDEFHYEQGNVGFHQRQYAREQTKIQQWITKRKAENATRAANNQPLLAEDEWKRIFKAPTEPRLLDSLLITAQIEQHCNQVQSHSSTFLSKMFGIRNAYSA